MACKVLRSGGFMILGRGVTFLGRKISTIWGGGVSSIFDSSGLTALCKRELPAM